MLVSKAIVNLLLGGPSSLGNVSRTCTLQNFRSIFVQVTGKVYVLGSLSRILCSYGNDDVLSGASGVQYHLAVQLLCHPSLYTHTISRVYQGSLAVQPKGTGTSIEGFFAVLEDKESVSLDSYVGRHTSGLQVTLSKDGVNAGCHYTQSNFLGVHTTNFCGGTGSSRKLLGNHILKVYTATLKSSCIYVSYVISNYIQTCLVILHTGYTGVK